MNEVQRVLSGDAAAVETEALGLDNAGLVRLYEAMAATRAVDREAARLHAGGEIGFYVGSTGLEAVSVASAFPLGTGDWVFPSHRDVGMYLLRGGSVRSWFDQLFGNTADLGKGRQLPGHHSLPRGRFVSVSGRVGAQLSQAAGCAMAMKRRGDEACVLTSFGEAICSGAEFHAALGVASRFRAPVVFVGRSERRDDGARVGSAASIAARAESYGVTASRVEGGDALAVYRAVREARENALRGGGPSLIEAVLDTAALFGDSAPPEGSSPSAADPLTRLREFLEECGAWDGAHEEEMTGRLRARVEEAVSAARAEPRPRASSLFTDVYAALPWMLQEQRELTAEGVEPRELMSEGGDN